ncbi:hypothetical protein [Spiroplasma monobiae]|uniref:Uncharacterized protein n=1 Tax=Spiroplasma monobiae MQ-1 TaxID=1336748 RepID=A0A2K9LUM6_SPISQ|nr:hypothetical protein [Spiroplasma monobiae]AUM62752.1 hypothetical protein SMONO_v1c05030 [Spiroplasma monobiae MQ-1]
MEINNFLKHLNTILNEKSCSQIEFYAPQDVLVTDGSQSYNLKDVYKVHYLNGNYKFVNLFFTFDGIDRLVKANNQNNLSFYLNLVGKEKEDKARLIESYLDQPSNLGLTQLFPSIQHWPIVFLDQIADEQINIFVHILEHKNLLNQSITNYDCLFIDTREEFISKFLPLWV